MTVVFCCLLTIIYVMLPIIERACFLISTFCCMIGIVDVKFDLGRLLSWNSELVGFVSILLCCEWYNRKLLCLYLLLNVLFHLAACSQ